MPPLTSPAGCGSYLRLTQQISELQERISVLYQIRDKERIMDSPVTVGRTDTTTATGELDSTVPCLDAAAAQEPKFLVSSTPSRREPWTAAGRGNTMVGSSSLAHTHLRIFSFPTRSPSWTRGTFLHSGVTESPHHLRSLTGCRGLHPLLCPGRSSHLITGTLNPSPTLHDPALCTLPPILQRAARSMLPNWREEGHDNTPPPPAPHSPPLQFLRFSLTSLFLRHW